MPALATDVEAIPSNHPSLLVNDVPFTDAHHPLTMDRVMVAPFRTIAIEEHSSRNTSNVSHDLVFLIPDYDGMDYSVTTTQELKDPSFTMGRFVMVFTDIVVSLDEIFTKVSAEIDVDGTVASPSFVVGCSIGKATRLSNIAEVPRSNHALVYFDDNDVVLPFVSVS